MSKKLQKNTKSKATKIEDLRTYLDLLHVNNFKSLYTNDNSHLNIKLRKKYSLFGKNSAGKSSILQALKLIQQSY